MTPPTTDGTDGGDHASCSCPQDGSAVSRRAVLRAGGAVGALALLASAAGSLVHTQVAYVDAHLHRRHPGGAQPPRRLRRALGGRTGRRPRATSRRVPRSASRRRGRSSSTAGSACTRRSPRCGRYYQAGTFGGRARGRPAEPDPLPLRRHGGDGEGGARVQPAHRLDRPDGRPGGLAQPLRRHRDGVDDRAELVHRPEPRGHDAARSTRSSSPGPARRPSGSAGTRRSAGCYAGAPSTLATPALATLGLLGTTAQLQGDAVHPGRGVRPIPRATSATRCATWPG